MSRLEKSHSIDTEILGLFEAVSKLSNSVILQKDRAEIGARIANILVGNMIVVRKLGITDMEKCFNDRVKQLEKETAALA